MRQKACIGSGVAFLLMALMIGMVACGPPSSIEPSPTVAPLPTATATPIPRGTPPLQILESLPFKVVLPTYLPHGMKLRNARFSVEPPGVSEERRRRIAKVEYVFSNQDESSTFTLRESIEGPGAGDPGARAVTIRGVQAIMYEDTDRGFVALFWPGKHIAYYLSAFLQGRLTKNDIISIVESIIAVDAAQEVDEFEAVTQRAYQPANVS